MNARPTIGQTRPAPLPQPERTLGAARAVLNRPDAIGGPGWARSVVLLARQALEEALHRFWARREPAMERATGKSRLVALRYYVDDPDIARCAHHTWSALSDACHHRGYDLAPTATELHGWVREVERFVAAVAAQPAAPDSAGGSPPPRG